MPWVLRETQTRQGRLKRAVEDWAHEHGPIASTWAVGLLLTAGAAIYLYEMGYLWWLFT